MRWLRPPALAAAEWEALRQTPRAAPVTELASAASSDAGDAPPERPLNITAAPGEHIHNVGGRPAAVDNRAPKMMGKLIIDLGVPQENMDYAAGL